MIVKENDIRNLIDAWFDGALDDAELCSLEQTLLGSPAARELFWKTARMHVLLRQKGEQTLPGFSGDIEVGVALPVARRVKGGFVKKAVGWAAAAALVLAGIGLWEWRGGGENLSQRHGEHGEGGEQLSELSRGGFTAEDAEGRGGATAELTVVHAPGHDPSGPSDPTDHSDNPLAGGRGGARGGFTAEDAEVRGGGWVAEHLLLEPAVSAVAAPLHCDPTDQTDPSDPTDHSRDPPAGAAALAAERTISAAGTEPAAFAPKQPAALAPRKEEEACMTATQKLAAVVSAAALTGMAQLNPANVADVTVEQLPNTRMVKVTYNTDGTGIATCQFLDDGEPIGAPGEICTINGDIHQLVGAGEHEFTWNAGRDLSDRVFSNLTVEVKLWVTNNPPEYCAVRLVNVDDTYRVRWYGSESEVPWGITNDSYKTTYLLLRKIPSTQGEDVTLGSPADGTEIGRDADREEQHDVRITKPFYIGVYEVTQKQWHNVGVRANPSNFKGAEYPDADMRPVEMVSYYELRESGSYATGNANYTWPNKWHDVSEASFMGKLRSRTGNMIEFDLPTEAQWEYACRAGTTGPYNVKGASVGDVSWYSVNSGSQTHVVGGKLPNAWGLYDMHGNVYEMCLDWFVDIKHRDIPAEVQGNDPVGPGSGTTRTARGGSCLVGALYSRSAYRYPNHPVNRFNSIGFRVAAAAVVTIPGD